MISTTSRSRRAVEIADIVFGRRGGSEMRLAILIAATLSFAGCGFAEMLTGRRSTEAAAVSAAPAKTSDHAHEGLVERFFRPSCTSGRTAETSKENWHGKRSASRATADARAGMQLEASAFPATDVRGPTGRRSSGGLQCSSRRWPRTPPQYFHRDAHMCLRNFAGRISC